MKLFYMIAVGIWVSLSLIIYLIAGDKPMTAWAVGFAVSLVNVGVIQFSWTQVLGKKSVAWPGTLIVVKYTLLTYLLYVVVTQKLLSALWLTLGLAAIVLPALVFSLVRTDRGS